MWLGNGKLQLGVRLDWIGPQIGFGGVPLFASDIQLLVTGKYKYYFRSHVVSNIFHVQNDVLMEKK